MDRRDFLMSTAVLTGGRRDARAGQPQRYRPDGRGGLRRTRLEPRQCVVVDAERGDRRALRRRRIAPRREGQRARSQGHEEAGDLRRLPQDARGQEHRRRLARHAEPLAHAADDLGLPGGQGRLRREAVLAQRLRIAADRRGGAQVRPHRPAGQPEPIVPGAAGGGQADGGGRARRGLHGARAVLQVARHDRPRRRSRRCRPGSTTTCGPAPRRSASSPRTASTTTGTGSGTPATATSATRASTRSTSPAGASASRIRPRSAPSAASSCSTTTRRRRTR